LREAYGFYACVRHRLDTGLEAALTRENATNSKPIDGMELDSSFGRLVKWTRGKERFPAMTIILNGVATKDAPANEELARELSDLLAQRGQVAYRVLVESKAVQATNRRQRENRANARKKCRLDSGKVLDNDNRFICECLIYDRSQRGLRLKLPRNLALPKTFRLYDDWSCEISLVSAVWRRDSVLGVRRSRTFDRAEVKETVWKALRGRYYAVRD
jgi:hypothetical protein